MFRYLNLFTPIAAVLAALLMCSQTTHAQLPTYLPTDGLVGWWPFNGNANDESGNGNDGVVNGATFVEDRLGNLNQALYLNNTQVTFTDNLLIQSNQSYTFTYWLQINTLEETHLFSQRATNGYTGFEILLENNEVWPYYGSSSTNFQWVDISNPICLGTFHLVNVVINTDIDSVLCYVDGIYNGGYSISNIGSINNMGEALLGARTLNLSAANFTLDEFGLHNRALTQEEITSLYSGEPINPPAACNPLPTELQNGLVGYWPFCGNANDESGNGNDGVVNGAALTDDRFGNSASAYNFDGINDFIYVNDSPSLSIDGDFTIAAWKLEDPTSNNGYHSIVTKRLVGDWSYNLSISKIPGPANTELDRLFTGRRNNNGGQTEYHWSNEMTLDGVWQHVVVSVHNDTIQFYINGEYAGFESNSGNYFNIPMQNQAVGVTIGDCNCNNNEEMQGVLDDIGIWNRALSPVEIQELFTLDACAFTVYDTAIVNVYDTLTVYNTFDVYDTLTVYNTIDVYDTLTVYNNIDVYDTLTVYNNIDLYDTLNVYNTIDVYDTLTVYNNIDVYDTLTVYNNIDVYDTLTVYNNIDVYDTTYTNIPVYDTLTVYNTIDLYDTTYVTVYDTLYTSVFDTTYVTIYDTLYTSVTDTLIIDITLVGMPEPDNHNSVLIYPNPASDHITIDYGNFASMAGYQLTITNALGQTVFNTNINAQQSYIDINSWGALGIYYVTISDTSGNPVTVKKIVLE